VKLSQSFENYNPEKLKKPFGLVVKFGFLKSCFKLSAKLKSREEQKLPNAGDVEGAGGNAIKLFTAVVTNFCNKLECLLLTSLSRGHIFSSVRPFYERAVSD
jgi:hypothetical protein